MASSLVVVLVVEYMDILAKKEQAKYYRKEGN